MIYLRLFLEFLKIGAFSFGGAYGAIPLIRETALAQGWMDAAMFVNVVAVSESTPGPIMVNAATYIGAVQGGVAGAAAATLGVILPSFLIILLFTVFFRGLLTRRPVQAALRGIKPCLMGMILATGLWMALTAVLGSPTAPQFDPVSALLLLLLILLASAYKRWRKKDLSPLVLIGAAAVLGVLLY